MCPCHRNHPNFFLIMSERRHRHLLASGNILKVSLFSSDVYSFIMHFCILVLCGFDLFLKKTMPNSGLYEQILLHIVMWVEHLGF